MIQPVTNQSWWSRKNALSQVYLKNSMEFTIKVLRHDCMTI